MNPFDVLGIKPYSHQEQAVDALLGRGPEGIRDIMVVAPTGSGKSEIYMAAALEFMPRVTIIISPLIALVRDQLRRCEEIGLKAVAFTSAITEKKRAEYMESLENGDAVLVYTTPETLRNRKPLRDALKRRGVALLAVDEGHSYEEWADSFRPAYRRLGRLSSEMGIERFAVLSATLTPRAAVEAAKSLNRWNWGIIALRATRPNIRYEVASHNKWGVFDDVGSMFFNGKIRDIEFNDAKKSRMILYANTVRIVNDALGPRGLQTIVGRNNVIGYHAEMTQKKRRESEKRFRQDPPVILCATKAFGMGVDIPDIRSVCHFHVPVSCIDYLQESGRAGRDGKDSIAVLFEDRSARSSRYFVEQGYPSEDFVRAVYISICKLLPNGSGPLASSKIASFIQGNGGSKVDPGSVRAALGWLDGSGLIKKRMGSQLWSMIIKREPSSRAIKQKQLVDSVRRVGTRNIDGTFSVNPQGLDSVCPGWRATVQRARADGVLSTVSPKRITDITVTDSFENFRSEDLDRSRSDANSRLESMIGYLDVAPKDRANYLESAVLMESEILEKSLVAAAPHRGNVCAVMISTQKSVEYSTKNNTEVIDDDIVPWIEEGSQDLNVPETLKKTYFDVFCELLNDFGRKSPPRTTSGGVYWITDCPNCGKDELMISANNSPSEEDSRLFSGSVSCMACYYGGIMPDALCLK